MNGLRYIGIKTCSECGYSNILPFTFRSIDRFETLFLSKNDDNWYHKLPNGHEEYGHKVFCKICAVYELRNTVKKLKSDINAEVIRQKINIYEKK